MNRFSTETFTNICTLLAKKDEDLAAIIKQYGFPPMWIRPATFQTLILTILEQQISLASAYAAFKRLKEKADRLLLDVPCTGLGVLRRNPDAKWKLSPTFLEEVKITQQNLLRDYSSMVKPGGKLIYATCSILPSENENQINTFLQSKEGQLFTLENQKTLLPNDFGYDGFFMAKLKRNE